MAVIKKIQINGTNRDSTINTQDGISPGFRFGADHIANNPNLYEIQRQNTFEFVITDLSGLTDMYGNTFTNDAQEVLRFSTTSAFIPHYSQNTIQVKKGNQTVNFAGTPTFNSGEVVINDYIGANGKMMLQAWQHKSYNPITGKVGILSDYKKDCYLLEFTPDYQLVRSWILKGCWISNLTETNPDSENDGKKTVSATITYDWGYEENNPSVQLTYTNA